MSKKSKNNSNYIIKTIFLKLSTCFVRFDILLIDCAVTVFNSNIFLFTKWKNTLIILLRNYDSCCFFNGRDLLLCSCFFYFFNGSSWQPGGLTARSVSVDMSYVLCSRSGVPDFC